jgi:uncharacterized protein (UPF0254 family)
MGFVRQTIVDVDQLFAPSLTGVRSLMQVKLPEAHSL